MKRRLEKDYFQLFGDMGEFTLQAAVTLKQTLVSFTPEILAAGIEQLNALHSESSVRRLELIREIESDFITPIDRGDIIAAAEALKGLSGCIADILVKLRMYGVPRIHPATIELVDIITSCCHEISGLLVEMKNIKKSKPVYGVVKKLTLLEETAGELYNKAAYGLFNSAADPRYIITWNEIFAAINRCCKSSLQTANLIAIIIIKNR